MEKKEQLRKALLELRIKLEVKFGLDVNERAELEKKVRNIHDELKSIAFEEVSNKRGGRK